MAGDDVRIRLEYGGLGYGKIRIRLIVFSFFASPLLHCRQLGDVEISPVALHSESEWSEERRSRRRIWDSR